MSVPDLELTKHERSNYPQVNLLHNRGALRLIVERRERDSNPR
jgi:hypothetical protein